MEKCGRAGQVTDNNIIRRMRAALWMTKAKDTHPECDNVQKCGRAGQATDNNIIRRMRAAFWMTKTKDTHPECVTRIAFSNTTMGMRRCLNVTLYVHCLSPTS